MPLFTSRAGSEPARAGAATSLVPRPLGAPATSRWRCCPATATGSLDAVDVDPADELTLLRLAERWGGALLFEVDTESGAWSLRRRLAPGR